MPCTYAATRLILVGAATGNPLKDSKTGIAARHRIVFRLLLT